MNNEWQPIETAPKDGSLILIYSPDIAPHYYVASFFKTVFDTDEGNTVYGPTHWRSLPSPPEDSND